MSDGRKSPRSMQTLTAKKTANVVHVGGQRRMILESEAARSNWSGHLRTYVDHRPAVFKTVCGALLRRPRRFDSHPSPPISAVLTAKRLWTNREPWLATSVRSAHMYRLPAAEGSSTNACLLYTSPSPR